MWLPAFKYVKGLLAQKGQFMLPNGKPYEGLYHKLYNGQTFTGTAPNVDAIEIFADDSEPHLPEAEYRDKLVSEEVFPNPEDYDKGYFLRYFIRDTRNGKIIEVKKETSKRKLKEKYLKGVTIKWILEKPVKDIFNQGYLYKGAATRNKENVMKASLELKGIDLFITKFDQFANIKSDVEGYPFKDLSKEEKIRIIKRQSSLRVPPKLGYPHRMYDPKTGQGVTVNTEEEHEKYVDLGWVHEKPRFIKKRLFKDRPLPPPKRPLGRSRGGGGGGGRGYSGYSDEGINEEGNPGGGMGGDYGNSGQNESMSQY